jgi:hypothetical protein
VLQAIPHAERAVGELARVTRPGGTLHLVAEDCGMIHFPRRRLDPGEIWPRVPERFGAATGKDILFGRHPPSILARRGPVDVAVGTWWSTRSRGARDLRPHLGRVAGRLRRRRGDAG